MILLNERLKGIIRILKDTQDYITSKQSDGYQCTNH